MSLLLPKRLCFDSAVCFPPNNGVFLILDSEAEGGDENLEIHLEQENAGQWEVLSPESFQTASLDPGQHFFRLPPMSAVNF